MTAGSKESVSAEEQDGSFRRPPPALVSSLLHPSRCPQRWPYSGVQGLSSLCFLRNYLNPGVCVLVPRRRHGYHGPVCHEFRRYVPRLHTECWRSLNISYHNRLSVLAISLPASCWPGDQLGKASQGISFRCYAAWGTGHTGHLSVWKLYSASALFSPVPQTLPLFTFLARPLPVHSVRCSFDFCFQGPLVANIKYSLRIRWPMLSRDLTRIIPPAFWKMVCKTFETLSPSHIVKIDSMFYCCLILPDPNWLL